MTLSLWNVGFWFSSLIPIAVACLGTLLGFLSVLAGRRGASVVLAAAGWAALTQAAVIGMWLVWMLVPAPVGVSVPHQTLYVFSWILEGSAAAALSFGAVFGRGGSDEH